MARPKGDKPKSSVTFSIDTEVLEDIDDMAEKTGMTRSQLVNMMLRSVCFQETEILMPLMGAILQQRKDAKRAKKKKVALA